MAGEFVAVQDGRCGHVVRASKRDALLFDRFAFVGLADYVESLNSGPYPELELAAELQWLADSGVVFEPDMAVRREDGRREYDAAISQLIDRWREQEELLRHVRTYDEGGCSARRGSGLLDGFGIDGARAVRGLMEEVASLRTRIACLHLETGDHMVCCSLQPIGEPAIDAPSLVTHESVCRIVLGRFPFPDELTDWERVVDFARDPDSVDRRAALHSWVSAVIGGDLSAQEAEDELSALLLAYQVAMELAHVQCTHGVLESIVSFAGGCVEDLTSLNWSGLLTCSFQVFREHANLLEAEAAAPGRELSYISKCNSEFLREGSGYSRTNGST